MEPGGCFILTFLSATHRKGVGRGFGKVGNKY